MNRIILFFLIVLSACAAKKQAAEFEAQPLWMKQTPEVPGFYTGIGSSKKVGIPYEYQEAAKKDALADLAEGIAINISSTSVLNTIETKSGFTETFDQQIKVSTDDYLEGFEPVDFYENDNEYWVYYRISKQTYAEKKEMKKRDAVAVARDKYIAGNQAMDTDKPKDAITFYLQGLEAIRNYLGEQTPIDYNGISIDIGNEIYSSVNSVITSLLIKSEPMELTVKRGDAIVKPLIFTVTFKGKTVQGIPVKFKYSGGYLKNDRGFTDRNGLVKLTPELSYTRKNREKITAAINLKEIAQKAVNDLFIRGLVSKQEINPASVEINISDQSVALSIPDHYCHNDPCDKITKIFHEILLAEGFEIKPVNEADFVFRVKFTYRKGENAGGLFSSYLEGEITISDKKNEQIWAKTLRDIKGVGHSQNEARNKAFLAFLNSLDRIYFKQGVDEIK
ncbi:MAG: LPP20 family lipoprotein [Bacteroidales bacterium]|nr:LPP20 family lipoprotein [Bacteroidales bacterium]